MKASFRLFIAITTSIILISCATPVTQRVQVDDALVAVEARKQREIALQVQMEDEARLINIAYGIQTASVSLCGQKTRPSVGIYYANKYSFAKDMRDVVISALGMNDALQVIHVVQKSPAEVAGFKERDILVALNGRSVPTGEDAVQKLHALMEEVTKEGGALTFKVLRGGAQQSITVTPTRICSFPVVLSEADEVNAYADGEHIIITRGMLRFAKDDTELGLVVAHELAHNAMDHIGAKRKTGSSVLSST